MALMEGCNLRYANLEGSLMAGVNLRVATLKFANMQNCDLRSAILAGADLEVSFIKTPWVEPYHNLTWIYFYSFVTCLEVTWMKQI